MMQAKDKGQTLGLFEPRVNLYGQALEPFVIDGTDLYQADVWNTKSLAYVYDELVER